MSPVNSHIFSWEIIIKKWPIYLGYKFLIHCVFSYKKQMKTDLYFNQDSLNSCKWMSAIFLRLPKTMLTYFTYLNIVLPTALSVHVTACYFRPCTGVLFLLSVFRWWSWCISIKQRDSKRTLQKDADALNYNVFTLLTNSDKPPINK